jgi:hypothetical protein
MATILSILDYSLDDGVLTVEAVVDEMLLYRSASYYEPEEWVAGMCSAQHELADGETFPETEKQQIAFLEDLDLDWELIDYE